MEKIYFLLATLLFATSLFAQDVNPWQKLSEASFTKADMNRRIIPNKYETFSLDLDALYPVLKKAPRRFTEAAKGETPTLQIPMPDGKYQTFHLLEAPVMHDDLAVKYPDITTYTGWSETDPSAILRCGISPKGFHGMILSGQHSSVYIDVYAEGEPAYYVCYYKKDFTKEDPFVCHFDELEENTPKKIKGAMPAEKLTGDCQFRVYALALACTGEYAQFHGGSVGDVMAEFNIAMTRVNGIFERDVNVTMVMVPNNDDLIFLNAATDPYTNNSGGAMLSQNINTCNSVIGSANYDIGHVFSTGGGGVAFLNSACSGSKAGGVTGLGNPTGDPFYVDYVAHEMGHQYGGNHTQNNSCNRNGATAMEPGSASTIMGYAGICNPNVQNNSDDYFHAISLQEMGSHVSGNGGNCADLSPNGNNAPTVSGPGAFFNVPAETAFVLTGEGDDPDGNGSLTYCWEQMDNEVASMPPSPNNTGGPAFRSLLPTADPSRYFPNLNAILSNSNEVWEVLPAVSRNMSFRCTVRDNNGGGGCTGETDVTLSFDGNSGPFLVTEPNSGSVVWSSNFLETVTWDVANTDAAPVNAATVDIFLSLDGGFTFPHTLATGTPNDGSELVQVPNVTSDQARIMVKGSGNVFLDISDESFLIEMNTQPTFTINASPVVQTTCPAGEVAYAFDLQSFVGFSETVNFLVTGVPNGATASFQPTALVPPGDATLVIGGLENVSPGTYSLEVQAVAVSISETINLELIILDEISNAVTLVSPADAQTGVATNGTRLEWAALGSATNYAVEVAFDPSFQTLEYTANVMDTYFDLPILQESQVYYWRVKGTNICNEGPYAPFYAFQTGGLSCTEYESTTVPQGIPSGTNGTTVSTIEVSDDLPIETILLHTEISHTWVGDLFGILIGPDGSSSLLFDRPGDPAVSDGCDGDDMDINLYDQASNTSDDLENTCEPNAPTIAGDFQPVTAFSVFSGKSSMGTWTFSIDDLFPTDDNGSLDAWSLEICGTVIYPPAVIINNQLLVVPQGQSEAITDDYLETEGMADQTTYIIIGYSQNGALYLSGALLELGSSFTQADINNGLLTYEHDGSMTTTDFFLFDVVDHENQWLHNQQFDIEILESAILASAELTASIDCFNASNGIITVEVTGGTAPISYSLNGGAPQNSPVFDGLGAGTYEVTVVDAEGLSITTNSIVLTNPTDIDVMATVNDDDITVDANGGTGNLMYSIDGVNFQNSNEFSNLANGTYEVTVMDENSCTATTSAVVAVNTLVVSATLTQSISCFNGSDGIITTNVGGGSLPYQYSLNNGPFQNSPVFDNLTAGTYNVTVMDADGLSLSSNDVMLGNPPVLTLSASVSNDDIMANGAGGTGGLQYSIDGVNFQSSGAFNDLANGDYTVTVQDANGCTESMDVSILVNTMVVTASLTATIDCFEGTNGVIEVEVAGGSPDFSYSIDGINFQSNNVFMNIAAGSYTLTVMDGDGFTQTTVLDVFEPTAISGTVAINGYEVSVAGDGGTGNLQYAIDGGTLQSENSFYPVGPGEHDILIVDENGCETMLIATVNVAALEAVLDVTMMPLCHDSNEGVLTVQGEGGVPPYTYSINNGPFQNSNVFTGLSAGTYTVAVMDSGGFEVSSNMVDLIAPAAISASASTTGNVVTVNANGGTGMLVYQLDGGPFQNSNEFTGVANGSHTIVVQDANGCQVSINASVNIPALQIMATVQQHVSCFNGMDGIVTVTADGGVPPYQYSLDGTNFQTSNTFENIAPGVYQPAITDAVGQMLTAPNVTVDNPEAIDATGSAFGPVITVEAMGGTGDLTYSFENMPFQNDPTYEVVFNGEYEVVVMDENGCTDTLMVVVNKPELVFFTIVNASCADSANAEIFIEGVDGGFAPYEFSLNNGPLTSELLYTGLGVGEYIFLVVDSTGYEWFADPILIDAPPPITASTELMDNNLTIMADGGTGNLQYSIDGGMNFQNGNTFSNLPNGTYDIVVMDENGCTVETTVEIDYTSLNEVDKGLSFEVTPNPGNGSFNLILSTETVQVIDLEVYNAIGQLVYQRKQLPGQFQSMLDLSELSNGNYQLRVSSNELWGVKRLVILK